MGNAASTTYPQPRTSPLAFDRHTATYKGIPRSPTSPHLAVVDASPQSFQSYNTSNVPALQGPPFGYGRLHTETEGYGISLPVKRQHVRKLSELIDPSLLCANDTYVKSPSGNLLAHADFCAREDRPLSLRERQERIRQQLNDRDRQASYAVSGISSSKSSPMSSDFGMFNIPEDYPPPAAQAEKVAKVKKRTSCCCF